MLGAEAEAKPAVPGKTHGTRWTIAIVGDQWDHATPEKRCRNLRDLEIVWNCGGTSHQTNTYVYRKSSRNCGRMAYNWLTTGLFWVCQKMRRRQPPKSPTKRRGEAPTRFSVHECDVSPHPKIQVFGLQRVVFRCVLVCCCLPFFAEKLHSKKMDRINHIMHSILQ